MTKNFTTIFPIAVNSHLIKDLGQIPHFLNIQHGYHAKIVSYKNSESYFHAEGEVYGVEMEFIENTGKKHFWEKGVIDYLQKNASDIDVLNLYHFKKDTFIYGNLYKKLNPKGKLYVKMDAYNEHLEKGRLKHTNKALKRLYFKHLEKELLKNVDLLSIENTTGMELVLQHYPELKNRLVYLPNGVNDTFLKQHFPTTRQYEEKENLIVTVGRIGLDVKNNEMLLKVIPHLDLKDWKVKFVGPIYEPFERKINDFYETHPELKDKVEFIGEVSDREALYSYYDKAKICCMTSPFESFGIAFVEAMYFGNYIVGTTGMSAFKDLSNGYQYGSTTEVNDISAYADVLQKLISDEASLKGKCEDIKQYTKDNFLWSSIVNQLNRLINE